MLTNRAPSVESTSVAIVKIEYCLNEFTAVHSRRLASHQDVRLNPDA
jgi:hypothetical protein